MGARAQARVRRKLTLSLGPVRGVWWRPVKGVGWQTVTGLGW